MLFFGEDNLKICYYLIVIASYSLSFLMFFIESSLTLNVIFIFTTATMTPTVGAEMWSNDDVLF